MLGQGLVGVALDYGGSRVGLGLTLCIHEPSHNTRSKKEALSAKKGQQKVKPSGTSGPSHGRRPK